MSKKKYPERISVVLEQVSDKAVLSASLDPTGADLAIEGETIHVAIYKFDHYRIVSLVPTSRPAGLRR
jgi:hypothetical protein